MKVLRVVSANLWNGRADPRAFAELVSALEADVVAVQELSFAQADALGRVLPHGLLEPSSDYMGMGIALRRAAAVRRIPLPCRDARVIDIELLDGLETTRPIEIINVHVQAPHSPISWQTVRRRAGQLRGLMRHLHDSPERPRVLVGDLNATPRWPFYRRLAAIMSDAAIVVARREGRRPEPTWAPRPGLPRLLRIDHAFVSRLAVRNFRVVSVEGGDHSAIVVDLSSEAAGAVAAGEA